MPESLDRLRDALTEAPVHPLPAAEVRRLGDRRRRRTASFVAAGAALVVAAVVVPLTLRGDGDTASTGPSSGGTRRTTTIPAGFPISDGMGAGAHAEVPGSMLDPGLQGYRAAGRACSGILAWSVSGSGEVAFAADGTGSRRTLMLFPDDTTAAAALADAQKALARCDARKVPAGTLLPQELETNAGEDSFAFVDPDAHGWVVTSFTRVGNAELVEMAPAPALPVPSGADPLTVSGQSEADEMAREATRVISSMCVFAATPCASGDASR